MRSLVRFGALSATVLTARLGIVLVVAVLGAACSAESTVGADAPEATQTEAAPTEQIDESEDRGVAVAPLPTATPTTAASPAPDSGVATFDRVIDQDLNRDGTISQRERATASGEYPTVTGSPAIVRLADIASVDYRAEPAEITSSFISGSNLAPIDTSTTSADGQDIWVPIHSSGDNGPVATCGDAQGTRLGIQSITSTWPSRPATPIAELPPNVSAIHHGPDGHVLLYTSCGGETRPAAFAVAQPDGHFTNVTPVDPLLAATTFAGPPAWQWGERMPVEDYFSIGSLIAIVPQRGLTATGADPDAPAHVYLDVETGEILDVWENPTVWSSRVGYGLLTSDGRTATMDDQPLDLLGRPISTIAVRQLAGPGQPGHAVIGGLRGAAIVTSELDGPTIERLNDRPVTAAAWAPTGPWVALSGPGAGTWLYGNGETIELSDLDGQALYFSPDGSKLIIATPSGHQVITFASTPRPSDDTQVTAFSTLDSGGLGPIRLEATVSSLRSDLDMEFEISAIDEIVPGYCVSISSPDLPGVYMLAEAISSTDAVVTSIVVFEGPWKTPSGLRVGSTQADVYEAFPDQLSDEPHRYIGGSYLTFEPADPNDNYSIKFETNGHQVRSMHAGRKDWIRLIEGCA